MTISDFKNILIILDPLIPTGMTIKGAMILLEIYLDEGHRISHYNDLIDGKLPSTSAYISRFEKGGLVIKADDDTSVRGTARLVVLTSKARAILGKAFKDLEA